MASLRKEQDWPVPDTAISSQCQHIHHRMSLTQAEKLYPSSLKTAGAKISEKSHVSHSHIANLLPDMASFCVRAPSLPTSILLFLRFFIFETPIVTLFCDHCGVHLHWSKECFMLLIRLKKVLLTLCIN